MKKLKAFDVIGPVLIGPSSSHTAGACAIALAGRKIVGKEFSQVDFHLHGSFKATYRGHGTDMALVAGICGIGPQDERMRNAFTIAAEAGIEYRFLPADLGEVHPNTVRMDFTLEGGELISVTGSSVGGGSIEIIAINDIEISFDNSFPTLILQYHEQRGIISYVSTILSGRGYNIESMETKKEEDLVTLVVETTEALADDVVEEILGSEAFIFGKYIDLIKGEEIHD
ncbi:MAG: L-serine ammonia-lyase, iron-sulfur-dependent subunit beta [Tissierellia bacterium]|nr:L-serine ammonia-lyase, iron-sulfur-dependent subunit beta [Tissierellia bacterium]